MSSSRDASSTIVGLHNGQHSDAASQDVSSRRHKVCKMCNRAESTIILRNCPVVNGYLCNACKLFYYRQFEIFYVRLYELKRQLDCSQDRTRFLAEFVWDFLNATALCNGGSTFLTGCFDIRQMFC